MSLRPLVREFKQFPATFTFCAIWTLLFAALCASERSAVPPHSWYQWLVIGTGGGHRFGDLSLHDFRQGEVWRLITCTCVHYSILHIGLNMLVMYQLGTLIESWYGTAQFIFIYGVLGGGGNLLAVLAQEWAGSNPRIHSGGGSVVLVGLVAFCAVAGWRARDRLGASLSKQMVIALFLVGLLGILLRQYIDNWGHAGGALAGAALGLAHKWFLRRRGSPAAWGSGVLAALVLLACATAQVIDNRIEAPLREEEQLLRRLERVRPARLLAVAAQLTRQRALPKAVLTLLDQAAHDLRPPPQAEVRKLGALVRAAGDRALSDEEAQACSERLALLVRQLRDESLADERKLMQLRETPAYRRARASSTRDRWPGQPLPGGAAGPGGLGAHARNQPGKRSADRTP